MLQNQSRLRLLILLGTPLLTGTLLILHPLPESAEMGLAEFPKGLALYELIAPIAAGFLVVHTLFPIVLALLGLSVILLLDSASGIAAQFSRISAFLFVITYTLYETIIGTATGLLIRGAATLPPAEQAAIGDAVYRNYTDPIFGDLPSILSLAAWLSWTLAVVLAALALWRSGKPLGACILLALSFIFVSHASPLGPLGMLLFFLAVLWLERAGAPQARGVEYRTAPFS
jgi:hypothetical protein